MAGSFRHLTIERFPEKLRTLREHHQMTHLELAYELGYSSTNQIAHLEAGRRKPTAEVILKLSKLFKVSADVLLDDEREVE